ncbi:MAG: amino acid adenylation domain-containing protein [Actinomycetota bacterium]
MTVTGATSPHGHSQTFPLGHRQTMMWAGQMLDPDVPLFNMVRTFTIADRLDPAVFTRAFSALIDACSMLRTVVDVDDDGRPHQRIRTDQVPELDVVDLTAEPNPDEVLRRWVQERGRQQFVLADQLYDAALVLLDDQRSVWYLNQHHIIADAWSGSILLQRLGEAYNQALAGDEITVEPLGAYADFVAAEHADVESDRWSKAQQHWADKLADPTEPLVFYQARPSQVSAATQLVEWDIDGTRAEQIVELFSSTQVAALSPELTALKVFHTALFATLHRVTGSDRLRVGTPFHNRRTRAAKQTPGLFMNLFPLAVAIDPAETMASLAAKVGAEVFDGMQHAQYPLAASREANAFEVMLNYIHASFDDFGGRSCESELVHIGLGDPGHSVRLQVVHLGEPGAYRLRFELKADLFDAAGTEAFVDHFRRVLDAWLHDVEVPISAIDLLAASERADLVSGFNNVVRRPSPTRTVIERFDDVVAANGSAIAVVDGDHRITYETLANRSRQFATHLAGHGTGPGDTVVLMASRSADTVAAILAVLRLGAAYVPIEPGTPVARMAHILEDTGSRLVLTESDPADGTSAEPLADLDVTVVRLADVGAVNEAQPSLDAAALDHTAYVLFTSGSTGRPKGVPVSHRGLANYVEWALDAYCGGEARRFALFTSLAFDLTITSIFVPLTSGGSVVVYADADDGTPAIVEVCRDDQVDVMKATPSHLAIVRRLDLVPGRLSTLIVGGEDFSRDLADGIQRAHGPTLAIFNEYGPTETVVGCMIHRFDAERDRYASVPIGQPGANAHIFLLDHHGQPVPRGVIGEIHIAGPGVTAGYLNRPDLTAARFLPAPAALGLAADARLYRTGDLGRWATADARPRLEFLGRADDQVKVRGYRIELGEIEAVLAGIDGVDAAAVVARDLERSGETVRHLAGYYSAAREIPNDEIRGSLASQLPHYMVPDRLVQISAMPLTTNGKIDRAALPLAEATGQDGPPDQNALDPEAQQRAETLAAIWSSVFGHPVGLDYNFFDLGGDSIVGIQLVARAAAAGVTVAPRQLFEHQTIAELAAVATGSAGGAPASAGTTGADIALLTADEQATVAREGAERAFPLTPTQSGMLFHTLAEPGAGLYVGQFLYRLDGEVDRPALTAAWQAVVDTHPGLRSVYRWRDLDRALQVVRPPGSVTASLGHHHANGDHAAVIDHDVDAFLARDRQVVFELDVAPPQRLTLIDAADGHRLVWTFHHIALDGWSVSLVLDELFAHYEAARAGRAVEAVQRRPVEDHLRWLERQDTDAAHRFWTEQLAGFTSTTALPRRSTARAVDAGRGYGAARRTLSAASTEALTHFARSQRVTVSTVLQAVWGLVLSRYERSDDVVFGVTTSGRPGELPGAEDIVGMFVTTLPTRMSTDATQLLGPWLHAIQQRQLEIRDHEYASLADIQRWSGFGPNESVFDSLLIYENFPEHEPAPDATVRIAERIYRLQSNYPLSLIAVPGDELLLKLVYEPNEFEPSTIELLVDHVDALIHALIAAPEPASTPLAELTMVGSDEAAQLQSWAHGAAVGSSLGDGPFLPERIRAWADATPDAIAVACGAEQLTYQELVHAADQLARELRAAGVGPNQFVGLLLDRSVDLAVGILGVQSAGAAYVPLDPAYPLARLQFMVDDAAAPVIVTSPATLAAVPSIVDRAPERDGSEATGEPPGTTPATVIASGPLVVVPTGVERVEEQQVDGSPAEWASMVEPEHLAYMIYTSGSTGTPNGVPIDHANLQASTAARTTWYGHDPSAYLLLSSFSFDSSVAGIFWTLASGGRLVLPEPGEELDVRVLARLIRDHRVSHTLCLPSLYQLLLRFASPSDLATLATVIVAGEACSHELVEHHSATLATVALVNEYGPTEATVWCTAHQCRADEPGPVPIGGPTPGAEVVVLDATGRPAGVGVPGELHVGGLGLARGYHNRPELTDHRFVTREGRRLFRTGDVATVRPDGVIEFGGRIDHQVKIRGIRVELGEIEAVLVGQPHVTDAVAAVLDGASGPQITAYVTLEYDAPTPLLTDVQAAVREHLPDAFVPARLMVLDELPRLPNGKVDRGRLPAPPADDHDAVRRHPSTDLEHTIAEIWADLLPDSAFGIDDDFFDVGGHSLLAVSLVEKIRQATGADLPLASLLGTPTIAALAAEVRGNDEPSWQCLVPLQPKGSRTPIYLIPPAAGTALSFRDMVGTIDPDQPLYCFEPVGSDGNAEPHKTVEAMAAHYIDELIEAQPDGHYRIGGSCLGAIVAWEMACRLEEAGTPAELVVLLDAGPPHNGPTWSYTLPTRRTKLELVGVALDHARRGTFFEGMRAVWRRNRFDRIGRIHYRAQLTYEGHPLEVPIVWLESSEVAEERPHFIQQWRVLAGDDLTPIIIPDSTHHELMTGNPDQVRRMTHLLNDALDEFDGRATDPPGAPA